MTKVPDLMLEDHNGDVHSFNDKYKFMKFLGTGSFGFVVMAQDRESQEILALKVSIMRV